MYTLKRGEIASDSVARAMLITLYKIADDEQIRYVTIHNRQPTLFSQHAFTVCTGTIHGPSRERMHTFETREELDSALRKTIHTRISAGYRVLYSYFRTREYEDLRPALFA